MGVGDWFEDKWNDAKDFAVGAAHTARNVVKEGANAAKNTTDAVKDVTHTVTHPVDSLSDAIAGVFIDVAKTAGHAVLKWVDWFLLSPDIYQNPTVDTVTDFMKWIALALLPALMIYHILESMIRVNVDGDRALMKIKLIRMVKAILFIEIFPWIVSTFLKICEGVSRYFSNKGINFQTSAIGKWLDNGEPPSKLAKYIGVNPATGGIFLSLFTLFMVGLFIVVACQTVRMMGEFAFLCATASIAAISIVNDEINIFPVWWREFLAVIFTRPLQIILMYLIINCFATLNLKMVVLGFGLLLVLISGPRFLRQFLYSTGTGRGAMSAIKGASRMAAQRFILTGGRR